MAFEMITSTINNMIEYVDDYTSKNGPELMSAAGVAGTVMSTGLTALAAYNSYKVIEEHKDNVERIRAFVEAGVDSDGNPFSEEDAGRAYKNTFWSTTKQICCKMAIPTLVLLSSICLVTKGQHDRKESFIEMSGSYALLLQQFLAYRKRNQNVLGKEQEEAIYKGTLGQDKENKEQSDNAQPCVMSKATVHSKVFDDTSTGWDRNSEFSIIMIRNVMYHLQNKYDEKGYLKLSDVYKAFGFKVTRVTANAGWVKSKNNTLGMNVLDFGLDDITNPQTRAFLNGDANIFTMNFNVVDNIYGYLDADLKPIYW